MSLDSMRVDSCACVAEQASVPSLAALLASRGAADEHVRLGEQMLVMTNVCLESNKAAAPHDGQHWFRRGQKPTHPPSVRSFCRVNKNAKPQLTVAMAGAGVWRASAEHGFGGVVPCAAGCLRPYTMAAHDYCTGPAADEWRLPLDNETAWVRGVTLIGAERHIDNFNHLNRDAQFFSRVLRRGYLDGLPRRILMSDAKPLAPWSIAHLRALLPAPLLRTALWAVRKGARRSRNSQLLAGEAGNAEAELSKLPAARHVCFEATAQKLHVYPGDAADGAALRARAYAACGVVEPPSEAPPRLADSSYILLEERGGGEETGPTDKGGGGGKATRRVANAAELKSFLRRLAGPEGFALGGGLRAETFGRLDYCGQVRLVAGAAVLVGMHGQGLTNAIFMRRGTLLIELMHDHPSVRAQLLATRSGVGEGRGEGGRGPNPELGHQPMAVAQGWHYVATALAESNCSQGEWKFSAACPSHVNIGRLCGVLVAYGDWLGALQPTVDLKASASAVCAHYRSQRTARTVTRS